MFTQKVKYHFYFLCLLSILAIGACKTSKNVASNNTKENKENTSKNSQLQIKYAEQLGVQKSDITNIELYKFIDEWLGVRYKYGGKTKEGIDCSDLTVILCKTIFNKTIEVPTTKIFSQCNPINIEDIQEGDLVFFKIDGDKISHVGVYLQNNKFIHASTKKGVIISDLNEPYYKKYFYKAAKIK